MSSKEKMEMLTNMYKTVDKLWTKYKDSWSCDSCIIRDAAKELKKAQSKLDSGIA